MFSGAFGSGPLRLDKSIRSLPVKKKKKSVDGHHIVCAIFDKDK